VWQSSSAPTPASQPSRPRAPLPCSWLRSVVVAPWSLECFTRSIRRTNGQLAGNRFRTSKKSTRQDGTISKVRWSAINQVPHCKVRMQRWQSTVEISAEAPCQRVVKCMHRQLASRSRGTKRHKRTIGIGSGPETAPVYLIASSRKCGCQTPDYPD
jgi:hypothetical protein